MTTQMFLQELNGELTLERDTKAEKRLGLIPVDESWRRKNRNADRFYASPDTIDGKAYIAAYLRLADSASVSEVEAQGVIIQEGFNNGLYTSLIPVDKINEIAGISKVKRINVSPLKKLMTNTARQKTNVDDALTLSTDAISAGLKQKYNGTGVVLGIIDTGIDFNHVAFKDASGNSRIKQAYVYNGTSAKTYTGSSITSNLTDDNSEDHGTHTSSTAGGSSVKVSGTTVTVTDDHANATYGGMAPGADLYLAGINGLSSTYLSNAVKAMCTYADNQGKPLVVSNSWGSQLGPHDGTGDVADVYNSLFGDNHPNHVALFAASNDGGKSKDNEGGGYHVSGTASSSNPLSTILRSATYSNTDAGYFYQGIIANAWARSTSVSKLGIKIFVLDASTGAVKTSVTMTSAGAVSGLSSYYSGSLYVYYDQVESDKTQVLLYSSNGITSKSTSTTTKNGETYYTSKYTLAIQVYPTSGSSIVDVWGGSYGYFTSHLTTSGYNWKAGSDDMSVSDEAMIPNAISIGAYVSANTWKDYNGTSHSMADEYTLGDIAYFSSYATATESPTGLQYPWITAPGARLAAGINHNHTKSVDDYSYYGDYFNTDLVVNSSDNPYAMMEGTSMATPVAAGIVALWMQASLDANAQHKNLTVNDVKQIMKETAIADSYTTTGANASHFGNGKIDALAGIKYILGATCEPSISVDQSEVTFEGYATKEYTKTVTVTGTNLEGNIMVAKSGSDVFTVDKARITQSDGSASAELTITWKPTSAGTQTGAITLSSPGAEDISVSLRGTAEEAIPNISVSASSLNFEATKGQTVTQDINVSGIFLTEDVTATVSGTGFSISDMTLSREDVLTENGKSITVSFKAPAATGSYTGTLTLTSAGAQALTIALVGVSNPKQTTVTVYQLTNALTAGGEYLIVSRNAAGSGYALSHSGTTVAADAVAVNAADGVSSVPYIGADDVDATSVWTVASGYTFKSGSYYINYSGSGGSRTLALSTSSRNWTWNSSNNYLYYRGGGSSYYIYYGNGFSLTKTASNIYLYQKVTLTVEEEDPPVMEVDATSLVFDETNVGETMQKTITVAGANLTGDIVVSQSGSECFAIDKTSISPQEDGSVSATISVTYTPAASGQHAGSLVLASEGAEDVIITLMGTARQKYDVNGDGVLTIADVTALVNIILGKATRESDSEQYDFDVTDVNGDGQTTIADVTALVNIILGK